MRLVVFEHGLGSPDDSAAARGDRRRPARLAQPSGNGLGELDLQAAAARRLGALVELRGRGSCVVDLNRALAAHLALEDVGAPEAEADTLLPHDMIEFLNLGEDGMAAARDALGWVERVSRDYRGPDLAATSIVYDRAGVRLLAPVPRPGKIIAVARNYLAHSHEMGGREAPQEPVLFIKASSSVVGPEDEIVLPRASGMVDYEGELAVVVGDRLYDVDAATAYAGIAGYTVANDVTARDFQNVRGQRYLGKSCDTFAPLGPAVVTRDEIPDPQALELVTTISGEIRQKASTAAMLFPVAELLAFASRLMTLEPGDVLLTGTPEGVGAGFDPPRWLADGDVVEVEIAGIGRLRNHVGRAG